MSCESGGGDDEMVEAGFAMAEDKTTVVLRKIPKRYTRSMLMQLFDEEGFRGAYDFLYLPMDFERGAAHGIAFVNLISSAEAGRFLGHFQGFESWGVSSSRRCGASWCETLQGLDAHVRHFRNSPVMHASVREEFKPAIFEDGIQTPFPPPTRELKPPQGKAGSVHQGVA